MSALTPATRTAWLTLQLDTARGILAFLEAAHTEHRTAPDSPAFATCLRGARRLAGQLADALRRGV